jgi:hypothetical protein
MEQDENGKERAHIPGSTRTRSSRVEPRWVTIVLIVAFLSVLALPRTITTPGLSPVLIVLSALVLVFSIFGRE